MINQAATTAGSTAAAAEAAPEPRPEQPPHEQERSTQPHNTEVLVCRPKRKRQQPEWLQPAEEPLGFATGTRKRARPPTQAASCVGDCPREDCKRARDERDELSELLAREAAAHARLREELGALAHAEGQHLEGKFWLLLVDSEAFPVPEDLVHAAAEYEAGWLVVRGRWYSLEQRSPRGYKLTRTTRLIVISPMIP